MKTAFDALVLAIPAPQATPLLATLDHPFALHTACVKMVGSWTLMLAYQKNQAIGFDAAFVNQGPLRWVARDSSKPGRKSDHETWVLQASAAWSERHIEATSSDVIPELLAAFRDLGGAEPDECSAHRWRYADTSTPLMDRFFWDDHSKLGICGDWINGGKVEGAWLSGLNLSASINNT
jgi:predicted NAD/FAD-dependent oxidoreductase